MRHVNLETLANGAFSAQVNRAFKEVTENIQDPNTDALAKRKVTVTITFKPNKDRNFAPIDIQTKSALAPAAGMDTTLSMGKDLRTGEVDVAEVTTGQIPGQMSIEDAQAAQVSADGLPCVILSIGKDHEARRLYPSSTVWREQTPSEREKGGMPMYVTYADLFQFCIFICALVGLCYTIFKGRKK